MENTVKVDAVGDSIKRRRERTDRLLQISHRIAELSVNRGRLLARLRPITNELANLRREQEKLLKEQE